MVSTVPKNILLSKRSLNFIFDGEMILFLFEYKSNSYLNIWYFFWIFDRVELIIDLISLLNSSTSLKTEFLVIILMRLNFILLVRILSLTFSVFHSMNIIVKFGNTLSSQSLEDPQKLRAQLNQGQCKENPTTSLITNF